jgi:hypothetical protein
MKIVREHINEKFVEDSDPIHDMGIGMIKQIKDWLKRYNIKDYTINNDLTIDVHGSVHISYEILRNFPKYIQFNIVKGMFIIQYNNFTTLRGCPKIVKDMFSCSDNLLTSLEYAPKEASDFYCHGNTKQFTKNDVLKYCKVEPGRICT